MDKNDFIDILGQHFIADMSDNFKPEISDEDFEIVMFVYDNHPLFIGNKYDVARAFAALGMPILSHKPRTNATRLNIKPC